MKNHGPGKRQPNFDDTNLPDELVLRCPHCGENCTHQGAVTVSARPIEDGDGVSVTVSEKGVAEVAVKPSAAYVGRRQDLTIAFRCEYCPEKSFSLRILQHKGMTLLSVEVPAG